jgi:hypothetical protein
MPVCLVAFGLNVNTHIFFVNDLIKKFNGYILNISGKI